MWHLDEDEGETAYDPIDGNDGTIIGAAWATTGVNGSALLFDCGIVSRPPTPHNSPSPVLGAWFGSEVVAILSSGWIFTSW
jgi:hypothetical protein